MKTYEPCGAAVVGGLYTLNCGSSSDGSAGADAAVGDADVDGEVLSVVSGAVDARVGVGLLGVDIESGAISTVSYAMRCVAYVYERYRCRTYAGFFGPILSFIASALSARACSFHSFVFIYSYYRT